MASEDFRGPCCVVGLESIVTYVCLFLCQCLFEGTTFIVKYVSYISLNSCIRREL